MSPTAPATVQIAWLAAASIASGETRVEGPTTPMRARVPNHAATATSAAGRAASNSVRIPRTLAGSARAASCRNSTRRRCSQKTPVAATSARATITAASDRVPTGPLRANAVESA